jgi:hypothetical protein
MFELKVAPFLNIPKWLKVNAFDVSKLINPLVLAISLVYVFP